MILVIWFSFYYLFSGLIYFAMLNDLVMLNELSELCERSHDRRE